MDRVRAQAKLDKGYAKLARKLGREAEWFRPLSPHDPISDATSYGEMWCRVDPHGDFTTKRVALHGKPIWFAAFDRSDTMAGDYFRFIETDQTFFVAAVQDLTPTAVVECNRTITIERPSLDYDNGYAARDLAGPKLLTNWPVSLLEGTKGEASALKLPNDTRVPWVVILMPYFGGLIIKTNDRLTDDLGVEYIISSVELTSLGYRLTAGHANP